VLTFVLAEAELELLPAELLRDPVVQARAKRRRRAPEHLVLDQALDHKAMGGLPDAQRRGRPDLVHVFLLLLQDSPLNRRGLLRVLVHTRHDGLIRVRPDTRIMRNQAKFVQLAEDLLRQGRVPLDDPLLTLERDRSLASVLAECAGPKVLLDEGGPLARSPRFADLARAHPDLTFVLGGFPRGAFRQAPHEAFDHVLRVADEPLSVWSALVPVLAGCEDAHLAHAPA
jgi:rRNA small subunit pseudouridine methyltransferase Nep1